MRAYLYRVSVARNRVNTYFAMRLAPREAICAPAQNLGDATPKVTRHEAVDDGVEGAVRVPKKKTVGQHVREKPTLVCNVSNEELVFVVRVKPVKNYGI